MNNEEKTSSFSLIIGISGTALSKEERELLQEIKPLGVILFKRNYRDIEQLVNLISDIKNCIGRDDTIICVDQEGGRVQRFGEPFTIIPAAEVIGSTENEYLAEEVGRIIATELLACGVNMDLAPVCDINTNPENKVISDRAFGKSADIVMRMSESVMNGMSQSGLLTCAKHFPGHGDTTVDSHETLPVSEKVFEELYERELLPFINIIEKGIDAVMMSHILYKNIDGGLPASMSKRIIEFLRNGIGFDGVIISDDMEMKAISKIYSVPEAALISIKNGLDISLICHTIEYQREAFYRIKRYYLDNPEKIETKLCRIDKFLSNAGKSSYDLSVIGCKRHREIIKEILELSNS